MIGKVFTVLSKATGAVALGATLYSAHKYGGHMAHEHQVNYTANRLPDAYMQSNRLEQFNPVTLELKRYAFKKELDGTRNEFLQGVGGYISGFSKGCIDNIIPIVLGSGALMFNKVGKACAVALAILGVRYLKWDIFNIGKAPVMEMEE